MCSVKKRNGSIEKIKGRSSFGSSFKIIIRRTVSFVMSILIILSCCLTANAESVTYEQIVRASMAIIITNEGNYTSVVKDDCGAVSLGVLGWHATRALTLLQEIVAKNPGEAKNILGSAFYNEIVSSSYWETRIFTSSEAQRTSVLLGTSYAKQVQDDNAFTDIGAYVSHGQRLGITEPRALVFFADIENQNGYTGASNFYSHTVYQTGHASPSLRDLYISSSQDSRRTRTYNFCVNINWSSYVVTPPKPKDTTPPKVFDATLSGAVTSAGYTLTFKTSDNEKVASVYTATFMTSEGSDNAVWKQYEPKANMSVTINISDLGGRYGEYTTIIYAIDEAGNYGYQIIGPIEIADPYFQKGIKVAIAADKTQIRPGETFTCMAMAFDGSSDYSYRFELYRSNTLVDVRDWSSYRLYEVNPMLYERSTGVYRVKVSARDNSDGSVATAETDKVMVVDKIEFNDLSVNSDAIHLGETLSYTADATQTGSKLFFKFIVYCNNIKVAESDLRMDNVFSYKPTKAGQYTCVCSAVDAFSQKENKTSRVTQVIGPISLENPKCDRSYAVSGMTVKMWASSIGGAGSNIYTFEIYVDDNLVDEIVTLDNYINYTVQIPGKYTVKMSVRDVENSRAEIMIDGAKVDILPKMGDADLDGDVTAKDARIALRCSAQLQRATENFEYLCDVDGDGETTAKDARRILRYSAQLTPTV